MRTNWRGQGLARFIEELTTALAHSPEAEIVVACPTWIEGDVRKLLDQPGVTMEFLTLKRRMLAVGVVDNIGRLANMLRRRGAPRKKSDRL